MVGVGLVLAQVVWAGPGPGRRVGGGSFVELGGGKVSVDVKEADVRALLERLAAVGKVNLVMHDGVTGKVTVKVRRIPWRDGVKAVLRAKGLDMEEEGNVIWVAPVSVIQQERLQEHKGSWRSRAAPPAAAHTYGTQAK